eukprot:GHUV01005528.1.p1 GENE.GHUV01005528.1~~GHUV01005528.1.p1  ORF type:complete len:689 (+),score=205.63 GHUV01005528.1:3622-5688(+)
MAAASDNSWPSVLFSSAFQDKIKNAKVLAVGAGGIGCELLKTLVLTGFQNIEVIDLDTIETSNLNRQFLFRRSHVGQSKAKVAADVVNTFAPEANIKAYQANIKESRFGVDFFKGFDLVLNGLDNMDARRHVNRLCVAAEVPLVESGTAGYVGQVSVHLKGQTECYECNPKSNAAQKTYPICTLRNTPDKPIHCVVWAKELLFPRLFGKVEISDLDEAAAAPTSTAALEPAANPDAAAAANGDAAAATDAAAAAEAEAAEVASFFKRRDGEDPVDYAVRVFERLYSYDIEKVIGMEELWKSRTPPTPLSLKQLIPQDLIPSISTAAQNPAPSAHKALNLKDQTLWSVEDNARVFLTSIVKFLTQRNDEVGDVTFDKDDDLAIDFVTAASNLRSACYNITQQSLFDAKGMAGNIIHAIATTNAIVGGLIVVEALKLLAGLPQQCQNTFLREKPSFVGSVRKGRMSALLFGEAPSGPKSDCVVCGQAQLHLTVNTETMTLHQLVQKVIKQRLAVAMPCLTSSGTTGDLQYDEGEGLEPDEVENNKALLGKTLASLPGGGLRNGSVVMVDDYSQVLNLNLHITHQDVIDQEQYPEGFILQGQVPEAQQEQPPPPPPAAAGTAEDQTAAIASKKRGREDGGEQQVAEQQQEAKKLKQAGQQGLAAAAVAAGTADDTVDLVSDGDGEDVVCID